MLVKGSFGYLDPEHYRMNQLTEKSDVYSFGVVLFEVSFARAALNPSLPGEQVGLADWALHCPKNGTLWDVVYPRIQGDMNPEWFQKFAEIAEKCLADHGYNRPSMGDVVWNLEFARQLQTNPAGAEVVVGTNIAEDTYPIHRELARIVEESEPSDETGDLNTEFFSQMVNPKGR